MAELELKVGDWVEVKSKEEILQTLSANGQLDNLPFMPSMFEECGKRLRVYRMAHKTCDTVNDYKGRRMERAVHLEGSRCNGLGYAGCEAACLIYWKEAWLRKVSGPVGAAAAPSVPSETTAGRGAVCTEAAVLAATVAPGSDPSDPTYICQATQVPAATVPLPWSEMRQYVEDFRSGNVGLGQLLSGGFYASFYYLTQCIWPSRRLGLDRIALWLYDWFQGLLGGAPYPRRVGKIPAGQRTPTATLDLQPGELVRVKSYEDILATLDQNNKNRGLYFDAEVVPYCGRVFHVLARPRKIVNEKNGKMLGLKSAVILGNVFCRAKYSGDRMFCPRSLYQFMQEVWLERVPPEQQAQVSVEQDITWANCHSKRA